MVAKSNNFFIVSRCELCSERSFINQILKINIYYYYTVSRIAKNKFLLKHSVVFHEIVFLSLKHFARIANQLYYIRQ